MLLCLKSVDCFINSHTAGGTFTISVHLASTAGTHICCRTGVFKIIHKLIISGRAAVVRADSGSACRLGPGLTAAVNDANG